MPFEPLFSGFGPAPLFKPKYQMAAAIVALRANKSKPDEAAEEGSLFDTLVSKLPSIETWDTEFYLGVLVLGSVDDLFFIHFVA